MRILHVVPTFYPAVCYGGPIYSVLQLCVSLSCLGHEVRVVTTDANGHSRLTAEEKRDPVLDQLCVRFCSRVGHGMIAPSLVKQVMKEAEWADVIHLTAVYNFSTIPTILAARSAEKPLVWSPRGALQRWSGSRHVRAKSLWNATCRSMLPTRVALHVTSEEEAAESVAGVGKAHTCIIPNGIDIPGFPPAPPEDGYLKILFIGRLDPKKGLENLISSLPSLSEHGVSKWRLTIAGDGAPAYVARLRALVSETGTGAQVEFAGDLRGQDKYMAFANSDVVAVPSHTENFANVVAEGLAHARPVIASRATPWREIERHDCGLWVNNDSGSLASAIAAISSRDRMEMGRRGRQWMTDSFSWQEQARRMLSLYQELVAA
jgi:glycosyltransferase involved in cell wall biosynthesis